MEQSLKAILVKMLRTNHEPAFMIEFFRCKLSISRPLFASDQCREIPVAGCDELLQPWTTQWLIMGDSRKYPYHTMDGFHILTPPYLQNFQNALSPPCPQISIIVTPPSRSDFPFFRQTLKGSLICPISAILRKNIYISY